MKRSFEEKFWKHVLKTDGCWLWLGTINTKGYGLFINKAKTLMANRVMWELVNGPIPTGMRVYRKCDNRKCVNPQHLFLENRAENGQNSALRISIRIKKSCLLKLKNYSKKTGISQSELLRKYILGLPDENQSHQA